MHAGCVAAWVHGRLHACVHARVRARSHGARRHALVHVLRRAGPQPWRHAFVDASLHARARVPAYMSSSTRARMPACHLDNIRSWSIFPSRRASTSNASARMSSSFTDSSPVVCEFALDFRSPEREYDYSMRFSNSHMPILFLFHMGPLNFSATFQNSSSVISM